MKLIDIKKMLKSGEYKISKSPYSNSYYILKNDEEITWCFKPENSLRIANHWNWDEGTHCPFGDTKETIEKNMVCIFKNGKYEQLNCKYKSVLKFIETSIEDEKNNKTIKQCLMALEKNNILPIFRENHLKTLKELGYKLNKNQIEELQNYKNKGE